ncbi:MAG: 50S ribosomal protein L35 [Verrucomicrobia bacterium]|nr:50S ribosomal protein L35 [Verrucomicrobiota bacterium]
MPKPISRRKTKKSAAKRFKVTASGKLGVHHAPRHQCTCLS